jgi:hypothetical protein
MPNIPPEKEAAKPSPDVKYEVIWEDESPELQAEYVITWPREDMLSVDAVCEKTPPCIDLIADPKGVFENKECWPDHLCYEELMCQSTEKWAEGSVGAVIQSATMRWMGMHPLPIGRRAVMLENRALGGPGQENRGLEGLEELLNCVPFQEYERAMWALRIERRKLVAVDTLDLFGLATYPTEAHQRSGLPVAGKLAFSIRGHDRYLKDLLGVLHAAERWWA